MNSYSSGKVLSVIAGSLVVFNLFFLMSWLSLPTLAAKKIQYKVISYHRSDYGTKGAEDTESVLNKLGDEGWEYVGFAPNSSTIIFKK